MIAPLQFIAWKDKVNHVLKKILIGGAVTITAGLVIAATGWNFITTADMPGKYVEKSDFLIFRECNERDHNRIKDKLDKIYDLLIQHYTKRTICDNEPVDAEMMEAEIK